MLSHGLDGDPLFPWKSWGGFAARKIAWPQASVKEPRRKWGALVAGCFFIVCWPFDGSWYTLLLVKNGKPTTGLVCAGWLHFFPFWWMLLPFNNNKKTRIGKRFFPIFFPLEINHHLGISHAYRLGGFLCSRKPWPHNLRGWNWGWNLHIYPALCLQAAHNGRVVPKWRFGVCFFPRQMIHMILVIFDDAIHSHSAVCLVEHCFGPVFLEILCFIKGLMMFF